jgi:hypothetical protein
MNSKLEQIVLYKWKPAVTRDRVGYHMKEIRALVGKVDGLLSVRGGKGKFCYSHPDAGASWDDGLVLTWADDSSLQKWGTHPEHDRLAPGLIADLERILAFSVES